jgi:ribosome-associated protein
VDSSSNGKSSGSAHAHNGHATGGASEQRSLQLALAAAKTAADNRGRNVVVLDMRKLTPIFDYFVIASGSSRRQLHAMSEGIDHTLEKEMGDRRLGIEGYGESRWILLDYGNVVIHLFDDEARAFYDLEHLWTQAKPVDLSAVLADDAVTTGAVEVPVAGGQ